LGKKIVTFKLDSETEKRLKEIAEKRGKTVSDILRELISSYTETPQQDYSDSLAEILRQFEERAMEYIENTKKFCEEYSNEVLVNNPQADWEFVYDTCRYNLRRHAYNTLKIYFEEKVKPLLRKYVLDVKTQVEIERRIHEIINKAVKELYPSPYPPMKPP
jgi:predicted DNA-binding protein